MTADRVVFAQEDHAQKRVLIVDDNPQVLQDLRLFLETTGEVDIIGEASNGQEAVNLAHKLKPDVIVMDLEMPVVSGCDATREIKSTTSLPRIVILSVHAGLEAQENAKLAGADEYVVKGASYETLLNAILGNT